MTVYLRVETADRVTVCSFPDETTDHGFRLLEEIEKRIPGERDAERDRRWKEMRARLAAA